MCQPQIFEYGGGKAYLMKKEGDHHHRAACLSN